MVVFILSDFVDVYSILTVVLSFVDMCLSFNLF